MHSLNRTFLKIIKENKVLIIIWHSQRSCSCAPVAVERNFWAEFVQWSSSGPRCPSVAGLAAPCPQGWRVKLCTGAPSASHQDHDRWSSVQANFLLLWFCLLSALISNGVMKRARGVEDGGLASEGKEKFGSSYSFSLFCSWLRGDWGGGTKRAFAIVLCCKTLL